MILHPTVMADLLSAYVASFMLIYAASFGVQILRFWNIQSGSELQLVLERKTYLISTMLSFVFGLQLLSLFLFVFTADSLRILFVGAMCAAGTLNVNGFGYPTLVLKIVNFIAAGFWLVLNYADNKGYDYPLIKYKYRFLILITPSIVIETLLESAFFFSMKPDVITSCCGSLFSSERKQGLGSELASLPELPALWTFYIVFAVTLTSGLFFFYKKSGGYLFAVLNLAMFLVSLIAIISVISIYIYELPTHHCPFCIIMQDYGYIGYLLYLLLLGGGVAGSSIGILLPFRHIASLKTELNGFLRSLALISMGLYSGFTAVVTYRIIMSNLII
ncbi:MAG: hypothetical protein CTY18_00145 [Methylomonas sp.]|nr:MAG: hypothetical protein CTY18_00145 [Methylomonas sp.]